MSDIEKMRAEIARLEAANRIQGSLPPAPEDEIVKISDMATAVERLRRARADYEALTGNKWDQA